MDVTWIALSPYCSTWNHRALPLFCATRHCPTPSRPRDDSRVKIIAWKLYKVLYIPNNWMWRGIHCLESLHSNFSFCTKSVTAPRPFSCVTNPEQSSQENSIEFYHRGLSHIAIHLLATLNARDKHEPARHELHTAEEQTGRNTDFDLKWQHLWQARVLLSRVIREICSAAVASFSFYTCMSKYSACFVAWLFTCNAESRVTFCREC